MGAKNSKDIPENEFVFENPLLPKTFQLPSKEENDKIKPKILKEEKVDNKPESVSTFPAPETKNIEDIESNAYNANENISSEHSTNVNTDNNNVEPETIKIPNNENVNIPQQQNSIIEEVKKEKKKKYNEEPLPSDEWYKPLNIEKADEILSSEAQNIIEEHVREELYSIKKEQKN